MLLVYNPNSRERVAPEGGEMINRNILTGGVIADLYPALLGGLVPTTSSSPHHGWQCNNTFIVLIVLYNP